MSSKPSPKSNARKSGAHATTKPSRQKPSAARPAKPRLSASPARDERESAPPDSAGGPTAPAELSSEVMEFITAIDAYKRTRRRPFPSWSEVFEIVKSLGYHKSA